MNRSFHTHQARSFQPWLPSHLGGCVGFFGVLLSITLNVSAVTTGSTLGVDAISAVEPESDRSLSDSPPLSDPHFPSYESPF